MTPIEWGIIAASCLVASLVNYLVGYRNGVKDGIRMVEEEEPHD